MLHRRPWVAYNCTGAIYGRGLVCYIVVTLGVRKVAPGEYNATEVGLHADGPLDAPC